MRLPRGFRASAERLALELRGELDLDAYDRVDPLELARLYGIPVVGHTDLDLPVGVLAVVEGSADWSAATVFDGPRRLIVTNASHDPARLANSVAHELSHGFLEHAPSDLRIGGGIRSWNDQLEAEATELAAQILIPDCAARRAGMRGELPAQVAERFATSEELAGWRVNTAGGVQIRQRRRSSV